MAASISAQWQELMDGTATVLEWPKKAGQHCKMPSEYMMQELSVTQVRLDELWTFVRKKESVMVAAGDHPRE